MASFTASQDYLANESLRKELEIHIPKQTAIDKIGGIFCHICAKTFGNKKDFDSHYAEHNTKGIEYTCVVCKKQFFSYPSFRGHCYLNHVVNNKFLCTHCCKSFCKLSILNTHISTVHNYKCASCEEKFTSRKDLESHKVIHKVKKGEGKDVPPYDCFSCGKVIKTADMCESHIDDHCEVLYPCPICKEVQPSKPEATKHLNKHFDENNPTDEVSQMTQSLSEDSSIDILGGILCCHCDTPFRNRSDLYSHFMAEHEDKTIVYTCNICGKQYEKYSLFGDHCYLHFAKDRFQCDQCHKLFPRLSLLVIHTEVFHTGCMSDKPYTCGSCSHGFKSHQRLREHVRIVHDESRYYIKCKKPGCSATFEKPRDLILHQKNHNAFLDNWCRQCGLQFVSLSSAEKHLDVHRRKQYSCPICKRTYAERYLMVKHLPVHFETVLHVCKICGKTYNARNRLMMHLKTHSDLRSYKCTVCSKAFLKPFQLKQHLNTHAEEKPFRCTLCPKTFANYPNWSKHLTRMHDYDKPTIKRLKLAHDEAAKSNAIKTSPTKAESGIESAGSEMSVDLYTFVESDDSTHDVKEREFIPNRKDRIGNGIFNTMCDPISGEMSFTDTVNAVIDRIEYLDEDDITASKVEMSEFTAVKPHFNPGNIMSEQVDDVSDISAIVEDIDAMSGEMETVNQVDSTANNLPQGVNVGTMQYANLMPVDNAVFNTIPDTVQADLLEMPYHEPSACQPEYGPEFINQGAGLACDGVINLDDHILPHIDPLLTFKAEENNKMYVQDINNFNLNDLTAPNNCAAQNSWEPMITKVYQQYAENNDANRIYIIY